MRPAARLTILALAAVAAAAGYLAFVSTRDLAPSPALVDKIERELTRDPCIGSLDRWTRTYTWAPNWWSHRGFSGARWLGADKSTVEIELREADDRIAAGRTIQPLPTGPFLITYDNSPGWMASGSYDIDAQRLKIRYCAYN